MSVCIHASLNAYFHRTYIIYYIFMLCNSTVAYTRVTNSQLFFYFANNAMLCFAISKRNKKLPSVARMGINCDFPPPSPPRTSYAFASLGLESSAMPWRKITPRKGTVTMHLGKESKEIAFALAVVPP